MIRMKYPPLPHVSLYQVAQDKGQKNEQLEDRQHQQSDDLIRLHLKVTLPAYAGNSLN